LASVIWNRMTREASTTWAGGFSISRSTSPNITALAPMPSPSMRTITNAKAGCLTNPRIA
jgi:hypothetical protein